MDGISTRLKSGVCNREKLSALIDTYDKLVFSICYQMTGDYFTAEDLMQETFLSVFEKYHTFDGANEKAWICRIATNKSIDYLKSAGSRTVPTEETFFEIMEERGGTPEEICMEKEVKRRLVRQCESLRPPYNEIAKEHYIEEMSAGEIAKRRGLNVKTVHTQISRARNMLKKMYEKEEAG